MRTSSQLTPVTYPAPDPAKPYVYPGTRVLINNFGIRRINVLQKVVDTVAGLRGEQLNANPIQGDFDLKHMCAIHHLLFQDVFPWAGAIRTVDTEKQGQGFASAADIPARFQQIHDELMGENFLHSLELEDFTGRLAYYYYSIYSIHLFREGNSRALRHFTGELAAAAGYRLDFSVIDKSALLNACRHKFFQENIGPLHDTFRQITSCL